MFETLKRLYEEGKLNADGLEKAKEKGWISEKQAKEITAGG